MAEEQLQNLTKVLQQRCRPHNRQAKSRELAPNRGRVPHRTGAGASSGRRRVPYRTSRTSRTPWSTRQGAIQLAPGRRGQTPPNDQREKGTVYVIDPCGRTSLCRCDRKGRGMRGTRNPPVIGSTSLDRGLAEWHPSGAPSRRPTRPTRPTCPTCPIKAPQQRHPSPTLMVAPYSGQ